MNIISLAALTVLDAGPAGQIRAASAAGFDAVGLRLNPLLPTDPAVVGDGAAESEIKDLLSETGLGVLEIGVFPVRPNMDLARLKPIIGFSAAIGAKYIVCPVEDDEEARRVDSFSRLCELARAVGLTALVEFNPYSACPNLGRALDLLASARQPNSALCVDAFHLSRSGGHPGDLRGLEPSLLPIVHFCDARPLAGAQKSTDELRRESRTARLLPGDGGLPLADLLRALPRGVALSVEAPTAENAHLSPTQRARLAFAATRRVLERQRAHGR
jgi:sugar phosphate isomerase/epimerase